MRNQIIKNKEFNILSRIIDNATKCRVIYVNDDSFEAELFSDAKFEKDESVELFTITENGQLYFETSVKEVSGNIIKMWFPLSFRYLQKREYSRIDIEKDVLLSDSENTINARIVNMSAGGLKILTDKQIKLLYDYDIQLEVEQISVECKFAASRIEVSHDKFISSGYFKDIKNVDRIALVQYCFRKQIENSNK